MEKYVKFATLDMNQTGNKLRALGVGLVITVQLGQIASRVLRCMSPRANLLQLPAAHVH